MIHLHTLVVVLCLHCFHPPGNGLQLQMDTVHMILLRKVLSKAIDHQRKQDINEVERKQSTRLNKIVTTKNLGKHHGKQTSLRGKKARKEAVKYDQIQEGA